MIPCSVLCPVGFFLYGEHWILPILKRRVRLRQHHHLHPHALHFHPAVHRAQLSQVHGIRAGVYWHAPIAGPVLVRLVRAEYVCRPGVQLGE